MNALKLICTIFFLLAWLPRSVAAQSDLSKSTFWQSRNRIQLQFQKDLESITNSLHQSGNLQAATDLPSQLLADRDSFRTYIFLPPENKVGAPQWPDLDDDVRKQLLDILHKHANQLFDLARQEATKDPDSGNAAWALQLFNEVLFYHPDHTDARRILGHRTIGDTEKQWRVKPDRLRVRRGRSQTKRFGWPAQSHLIATTENFHITSGATEEQTIELAKNLEHWKDAWRQIFFEYYNSGKNLTRWIEGKSKPPKSRRKHKVFFFPNRNDYVKTLEPTIPGIAASTGYYSDANRESYFFADTDQNIRSTWRHEMTHQLFQESVNAEVGCFNDGYLWLGEGIAMYFESLVDHGNYVTLGGFDSSRLQYARMRRLKEQFRVPLDELSEMTIQEFQSVPELAKTYSQSAGVAHCLMNANSGASQSQLIEFLKLAYTGKLKRSTFENTIGYDFSTLENQYDKFLKVSLPQLRFFDATADRRELALIGVSLQDDSLAGIEGQKSLDWLDLSACDIRGQRLLGLKKVQDIGQLFLTAAVLDNATAKIISDLNVVEIDLSGSNIDDTGLAELANSKSLRSLNIAATKVTSAGIKAFSSARPNVKLLSNLKN
jgi:hypothetical protein